MATHMYHFFTAKDRELFQKIAKRVNEEQQEYDLEAMQKAWDLWSAYTAFKRKIAQDEEQRQQVISVLKNSTRGQRSTMEKEILRRYIIQHLTCIPKTITFSEMDQLCNEVDWYPIIGRSIIFLQGDFGNVYYMIANGTVGLYLEPSKDREMIIAREYGHWRGQPFTGTDEQLKGLGINILNLPKGAGFGEYAILATTNKIRSCAVVSVSPESFLMIMHAETYNAVLRQHHYRQKQLSSATALLSELPLFKHLNYSKIASIAYTMKSQTYSSGSVLAKPGQVINNVMLVVSGQIKVYAPPMAEAHHHDPAHNEHASAGTKASTALLRSYQQNVNRMIEKRIPRLAVSILGRGQIIGDMEVAKGLRVFQMTYESCAAGTEVLEMPATIFKENIHSQEFKSSYLYRAIDTVNQEREQRQQGRLNRAYKAMRQMMEGPSVEEKTKEQLMQVLPMVLDPGLSESFIHHDHSPGLHGSSQPFQATVARKLSMLPMYSIASAGEGAGGPGGSTTRTSSSMPGGVADDTDVHVLRRPSFDPRKAKQGSSPHRLQQAMQEAVAAVMKDDAVAAPSTTATSTAVRATNTKGILSTHAPPPSMLKKSQVTQSPRKIQFTSITPS